MADKHPYVHSPGPLVKAVQQFRNSLPESIDASVLKKLGLAPNNESYLINVLKFLKIIDEKGKPTPEGTSTFTQHKDVEFQNKLSGMMEKAYTGLFKLHKDKTWDLTKDSLISYFRETDHKTALVGNLQATTFKALASLAGHGVPLSGRSKPGATSQGGKKIKKEATKETPLKPSGINSSKTHDIGLTVRIEINLPASGDKETYDRIFKSIRENLLNG